MASRPAHFTALIFRIATTSALASASLAGLCMSACEASDQEDTSSSASSSADSESSGGATTCEDSCPQVLAAACTAGPTDTDDCAAGCAFSEGACPSEFSSLFACLGANPSFVCDAQGRVSSDSCGAEYTAFYACLGV